MSNITAQSIALISQTANMFKSSIVIQYEQFYIDVKSIMGLAVTLSQNASYDLHIVGPDASEAKEVMVRTFTENGVTVSVK